MNAKISTFVTCVEGIIYLLLCNLHDCNFKLLQAHYSTYEFYSSIWAIVLEKDKIESW